MLPLAREDYGAPKILKNFEAVSSIHTLVRDLDFSMSFVDGQSDMTATATCDAINIAFDPKQYTVPKGQWTRSIGRKISQNFMEQTLGLLREIDTQSRSANHAGYYKIHDDNVTVSFIPDENSEVCATRAYMF